MVRSIEVFFYHRAPLILAAGLHEQSLAGSMSCGGLCIFADSSFRALPTGFQKTLRLRFNEHTHFHIYVHEDLCHRKLFAGFNPFYLFVLKDLPLN